MKLWCLHRGQIAHLQPIEEAFAGEAEFVHDGDWDPRRIEIARPDVVLCINDYPFDVARCLEAARKCGIPSLVLQDGILEWRCQFENPLFGAGGGAPQHQPVLADKIACIGQESLRRIAGWGNESKVELTGMPRLDCLCRREPLPPMSPGRRLLVMTAKNPGFDAIQRETTLRSLKDLKAYLDSQPHIQVLWRLSKAMASKLDVPNEMREIGSADLVDVLEKVDAVITTPSTAMLEAMLMGRPVAVLDYHQVPVFVRAAWMISARDHLSKIVNEILAPSPMKMAFQQESLADNLMCDGASAQRVCLLIHRMVAFARNANLRGCRMPPDLLETGNRYTFFPPRPLGELYSHSVFSESDPQQLMLRLARAENENGRLKMENAELKKRVQFGSWLKSSVRKLVPVKCF